jgi:hypothetical protein
VLRVTSPGGVTVSYDRDGSGPPLVLVHGSFSDHRTNWEFVKPLFETRFTVPDSVRPTKSWVDPKMDRAGITLPDAARKPAVRRGSGTSGPPGPGWAPLSRTTAR